MRIIYQTFKLHTARGLGSIDSGSEVTLSALIILLTFVSVFRESEFSSNSRSSTRNVIQKFIERRRFIVPVLVEEPMPNASTRLVSKKNLALSTSKWTLCRLQRESCVRIFERALIRTCTRKERFC